MDRRYKEKLSHVKMLFQVVKADGHSSKEELEFVLRISARLGLSKEDVYKVLKDDIEYTPPIHESSRVVLFHQLLILIYIDGVIDEKELGFVQELSLKLGLSPYAVKEVLTKLYNDPETGIDPKGVSDLFKIFNN